VRQRPGTQIGMILSGAGQIGAEKYGALSTFSIQRDEAATLRTEAETVILLIDCPCCRKIGPPWPDFLKWRRP